MTTSKVEIEASLTEEEWKFLQKNAEIFELPSEGKALRCCINWARTTGANLEVEKCSELPRKIQVADTQIEYLESVNSDKSLAIRAVVVAAMKLDDPATIFKVVRCHLPSLCPNTKP